MPVHNHDIAEAFNQLADLLEIKGENQFRIRAYRNAARTIGSLPQNAADLVAKKADLTKYEGIGKDLAGKIEYFVKNRELPLLEELKKEMPAGIVELMRVAGLGAKRIAVLQKKLGVGSLDELKEAAEQGKIEEVEGFGKKTQEAILQELARIGAAGKRILLNRAKEFCEPLLEYLKKAEGVKDVAAAGSYRRRRETVGDLDILIIASKQSDIAERVCNYEDVKKVIAKGKSKTSVLLGSDLQVDVRVVPQVSFGVAMVYFTGSKEHCIALRKIGQSKKLKVNEYGVYKGKRRVAGRTEQEVYKKLGLEYIKPELRENRGEIEAAKENNLPKLIKREDIRGDFHVHSNYTDGHNTIEEMAEAARELGYKYIAITDHSQNVTVAGGLKPREVEKQIAEIDKLNKKLKGITILKGSEVDILEKGDLDLPDEILEQLDIVVCSVHSHFKLSRDKQTKRIIKAMDNPNFNILGHPTGRLINERGPYDVDMEAVVKAAAERGVMLELNSHFDRLDLDDMNCKMAKDNGVMIVISTDAHRTGHFDFMEFGIGQARRGWLEAKDILNTRPLAEVKKILKRK